MNHLQCAFEWRLESLTMPERAWASENDPGTRTDRQTKNYQEELTHMKILQNN